MNEVVVVDTNIIISALISGNEDIIDTLSRPGVDFVSSSFAFVELFKHSPRIQEKSRLQVDDLLNLLRIILDLVRLIDEAVVSLGNRVEASRLCRGQTLATLHSSRLPCSLRVVFGLAMSR